MAIDKKDDSAEMSPIARILFGWVSYRHTGNIIFALLLVACAGLTIIDFFIDRHEYFGEAELLSFYGIYGFFAFGFVVLMGWPLGRLLRRDENFYGDGEVPVKADSASEEMDT